MKTAAEKSSTTSAVTHDSKPFFGKAGGGDFFAPAVQAKLTVGKPGDKFEQEADQMAEKVVQRPAAPGIQNKCAGCEEKEKVQRQPMADGITPFVQRQEKKEEPVQKAEEAEPAQTKLIQRAAEVEPAQAKPLQRQAEEEPAQAKFIQRQAEEEPAQAKFIQRQAEEEEPAQAKPIQRQEEEAPVQAKTANEPGHPSLASVEEVLQGSKGLGNRLDATVRREMEAGFGIDLGDVRIHSDDAAVGMSQTLGAQAFTNGWDVYFNQWKYNPATRDGKLLLAHELTHTIQQAKANGRALRPAPSRIEVEAPPASNSGAALPAIAEQSQASAEAAMQEQQAPPPQPQAPTTPAPTTGAPPPPATPKSPAPPKRKPAQGKGKKAGDKQEAAPNQSPKTPGDDPDFAKAKQQIHRNAKKQRSHEPAEQKKAEMVAAAAMSQAEQAVQSGQDQKAGALEGTAASRPRFDKVVFKEKLKEKIESKMPETEGQANDFAGSGKLEEAKEEFKGSIAEEKGKVSGPLEQTAAEPLPPGQNLKADNVAVPAAQPAAKPSKLPPALATPKPRTDEEISLQHESDNLDNQMTQEGITEPQLAESEEPQFEQALEKKKDAQREIAAAPGQFRQVEEEKLGQSQKQTDKATGRGLRGMEATKNQKTGEVRGGQLKKETETEKRQREIKEKIDGIYKLTEKDVNDILTALAENVQSTFALQVEAANETFKSRVRSRLDDHYGWFTFDDKIAEWAGLSDGVAHIFRQEKERFLATMDLALDGIATTVETELNRALDRIQQGRRELEDFKKTLNDDELKFAADLFAEAGDKFTELEASVDESQEELVETLSDQYVESVNKLQEEFDKINEELSASWIADALSFIGEVATAIKKLGQLLSSIISRIGDYVSDILAAPKRFFNNLVDGIKGGMDKFSDNIDTYLEQGFWMWLTGAGSAKGIQIPEKMDVQGMFLLAAQMVGISKEFLFDRIKAKLMLPIDAILSLVSKAEAVGEKLLEPVRILLHQGVGALWEWVKQEVSSHLQEIFSNIKQEIFQAIIRKFLLWVASLFIPGLGFIRLIQAAYKALRWLVDNIDRIVEIVNTFLDAIGLAVKGNVGAIIDKVVKALTLGVVVAIDFLAKLVGLGNFADKLQRAIQKLKKPIQKVIDGLLVKAKPAVRRIRKAIEKAVKKVKKGAKKVKDKVLAWWKFRKGFKNRDGESHTLFLEGQGSAAQLMVQTQKTAFEKLISDPNLQSQYPRPTQDAQTNYTAYKNKKAVLIKAGKTLEQQKKEIDEMHKYLNNIMGALAKMGSLKSALPKPPPQKFIPSGNKPTHVEMQYLSKPVKHGTPPKEDPVGWDKIEEYELSIPGGRDHWIRFHLINENLGGEGRKNNLIATPNSTNKNYEKFEKQVKRMVDEGTPKLPKVVWLAASVPSYHKGEFKDIPAKISAEAGIYLPKEKGNTFEWKKESTAAFNVSLTVTDPELSDSLNASLNASGRIDLNRVLKRSFRASTELTLVVNAILRERTYKSIADFKKKFVKALTDQRVDDTKAEAFSERIVNNPRIKI